MIDYILNIRSYEATLQVTVQSNKTTNQYLLEQFYLAPNYAKQIVKEPSNIANLETVYDGKSLKIKNTNLGLDKIYQNYAYLNENTLWLSFFLENYQKNGTATESQDEIILSCHTLSGKDSQKLYLNKKTALPTKLEIIDNSNQMKIYIEYKEIKLNTIHKNTSFAFYTKDIQTEV